MFSKYLYINNKAITCIQTCVSMLMCLNSVVSHELAWIAQDDLRVDIVCVFFTSSHDICPGLRHTALPADEAPTEGSWTFSSYLQA